MFHTYNATCTDIKPHGRAEFLHKGKTVVVMYPAGAKLPEVGEVRQIRSYGVGRGSFWADISA